MTDIRVFNAHPEYRASTSTTTTISLARRVLAAEHRTRVRCSIVYIDDRRMIELNTKYLRHRYTTDVLTFPLHEEGDEELLGDVYISLDQARRQAAQYAVSIKHEVARLVIHGVLHLVGHRDTTRAGKKRMTELEDEYLLQYT